MDSPLEHTPNSHPERRNFAASLMKCVSLLVLAAAWTSCITLPSTNPNSFPTLTWQIQPSGGQAFTLAGPAIPLAATPGTTYRITLMAEDGKSGVQAVSWDTEGEWECTNGELGQQSIPDFAPEENVLADASAGDLVPDTLKAPITGSATLDPNGWTCSPGFSFVGGSVTLHGSASNYFGNTTDSDLTFSR